jgi:hypothetical protein
MNRFFSLSSKKGLVTSSDSALSLPVQDGKAKKSVERRESTRLQNAAKLLRNLSKSKDLHAAGDKTSVAVIKMSPPTSATAVPGALASSPTGPTSDRRHHPAYQSEGKGKRRERRGGGGGDANDQPTSGRSAAVERAHSFCGSRDSRKEQRKATAATAAGAIGDKRWLEMSRSCHRLEERLMRHNQPSSEDSMSTTRSSVDEVTSLVALKGEEVEEGVVVGAKSILLTEDNLKPVEAGGGGLQCGQSPDLIQDLPSDLVAHAQQQQQQSSPARQLAAAATTAPGNSSFGQTQLPNVAAGLLESNIGAFVNDRGESVDDSTSKNHIDRKDVAASLWSGSFSASAEPQAARSARPRPTSLLVAASQLDAFVPERPTAFESTVNDMDKEEDRQQLEMQLHDGKQLARPQPKGQQFERQLLERPQQLERPEQLEKQLLERPQQLERLEQLERQQTESFWPAQEDTETGVER